MEDIIKMFKSLGDSSILVKDVTKTIGNETKEERSGFLGMLLGTLGAILLGHMFVGKVEEKQLEQALIQSHPLTNCETKDIIKCESQFNGVYSRNNLLNS